MKLHNILFTLFLICIGISSAGATTEINSSLSFPYTLGIDGETYVLTENITSEGVVLIIGADNVTLNGGGYTAFYANSVTGNGVSVTSKSNFTITDLCVRPANRDYTGSATAVKISGGSNGTVLNCMLESLLSNGLSTSSTVNFTAVNVTAEGHLARGLMSSSDHNITLYNCAGISDTSYGLCTNIDNNATLINCIGKSNTKHGLCVITTTNSTFLNCVGQTDPDSGLYLTSSSEYNILKYCRGYSGSSGRGICIASDNNTLENCIGYTETGKGIEISSGIKNTTLSNVTSIKTNGAAFQLSDMIIKSTTGIVTININDWSTNQRYWSESSDVSQPVTHIIQCEPYSYYKLYRDGDKYAAVQTSATGLISWVYDGGFSSHTFSILPLTVENMQVSKLVDETLKAFELASVSLIVLAAASIILLFKGNANINTLAVTAIISMAFLLLFGVLILSKIKSML